MSIVTYTEDFVSDPTAKFNTLWDELAWVDKTQRRREYWTNTFDRSYRYGTEEFGRVYDAQPGHPVIDEVTDALETLLGFRYEACFLNGYETGRNALSYHADDDPSIDHSKPIAIVTLYDGEVWPVQIVEGKVIVPKGKPGARLIQFRCRETGEVETVSMPNGSLLLMPPGMQDTHLHQIPKAGYVTKRRISLTYRSLKA